MSRFPAITETFILRELVELDRAGIEVVLVPLLHEYPERVHPDSKPWEERALYTPFLNLPILAANLRVFLSRPWLWLSTFAALMAESASSANAFFGTLGIFFKSVYNGQRVRALGVGHIHAHFATHPATAAHVMSVVRRRGQDPIPYSVVLHAHDIFLHQAGLPRKLSGARFVRSISQYNVDWLLAHLPPHGFALPREKFRVIHCGIELERYGREPERPLRPPGKTPQLLSIAAHRPYKGLTYLIEAVRLLRARGVEVVCDVIGEGVLRPQLEAQIEQSGLTGVFRLIGTRTQDEVAAALAACDVFVLPSIVADDGQMEGIPVALMESLASAVPSISTRISGIPELVIPNETGYLVEPANAAELADEIERVLGEPQRAAQLARAGRVLSLREFEIRACMRRLVEAVDPDLRVSGVEGK
jgi:glycosyltransferase involved in cell wall biosynthesis